MQRGQQALSQVLEHVADGSGDLDWEALEQELDDEGLQLVQQLRILARISDVHRSADPDDAAALAPIVIGRIEPQQTQSVSPVEPAEGPQESDPSVWGHLELIERVGHGTFGDVYRAVDRQLRREVALKLLRPGKSPERLQRRVLHEGRILARVRHPHVVVVHGVETHAGRVGLWMEFIRGATLEQLVRGRGPFSAREAALIGQDLCRAVAAVHGAGLLHRDIKAQNVMREEGGRVVLMDFGAVRSRETANASERLTGTPLYLAPEVLAGSEATVRSDVYSLGVLLYYLVTGSFPVQAASLDELRQAHAAGEYRRLHDVRPNLPDAFVRVVERALASAPAARFASAGEFQTALGHSLDVAAADRLEERPRVGWRWGLLAAAVCALVAAAGLWAVFTGFGGWRSASSDAILVAVLPFDRPASIPEYVSENVARSVADLLTDTRAVTVVSIDAARVLKAGAGGWRAQEAHGIDYVVEGRLTEGPRHLKADVALLRWGQASPIWRASVEGSSTRLPSDVARSVLEAVSPGAARHPSLARAADRHASANDLVAQARYALEHGPSRERTAISFFKQALLIDAGYARAHSGMARAYLDLGCPEGGEAARAASLAALAADARSSEAHTVLGDVRLRCDWDWEGARDAYHDALTVNPSDEYARYRHAMFLASLGRPVEALGEMLRAREQDFHSPTAAGATAMLLYYNRRFEEAEREVRRALQMDDQFQRGYLALGRILAARGQFVEAGRAFAKAEALDDNVFGGALRAEIAAADAGAGRGEQARQFLAAVEGTGDAPAEMIGFVYARLGDRDKALQWIEKGIDERSSRVMWLKVDPRADPLRADPRFDRLVSRLAIPSN
jgi:serine/threonine-protein kinase